jgi:molybdenum cofactor synthesis domain-containing protein
LVLEHCSPLAPVDRSPVEGLGRTVAQDVTATVAVPGFDNSAMDGFAVRAVDASSSPTILELVGSVMAGQRAASSLRAGEAVRIMTGAPVPSGADAVCPVEQTIVRGRTVTLTIPVRAGDHVRRAGEDVEAGDTVARAGEVLGPATIGLLEAVGCRTVRCHPAPRVGVLSTGDELLPGADGGIHDSNRAALLGALRSDGMPAVDLGVLPDEPHVVAGALDRAAQSCDAVITTGGVSVGDRDVVRAVLARTETLVYHWLQIAVKPAKPLVFAVLEGPRAPVPVFGLPGNPVSALVSYELFARPGLRRMAGYRSWWRPATVASAGTDFARRSDGKTHLVPSVLRVGPNGRAQVWPCPRQGSHLLTSLTPANSLVILPDGPGSPAGAGVEAWVLDAADVFMPPGGRSVPATFAPEPCAAPGSGDGPRIDGLHRRAGEPGATPLVGETADPDR